MRCSIAMLLVLAAACGDSDDNNQPPAGWTDARMLECRDTCEAEGETCADACLEAYCTAHPTLCGGDTSGIRAQCLDLECRGTPRVCSEKCHDACEADCDGWASCESDCGKAFDAR